ncbi:phage portal protein [Salmonella enterica]|nr:phage portal protein [Salmonella enterica]EBL7042060.1 phage portal protein [Salmonella enterica]HAV7961439.1 phage portal protein [Escherichia coli]
MSDNALETAFNAAAPKDEQQDAMAMAQKAAMPSSVADLAPLIKHIADAYADQEFYKSLEKPNVVPFPSKQIQEGKKEGMQSVWLDERQIQMVNEYYEKSSNFNFDSMRMMVDRTPILSAVIMTRIRQIKRFCRASTKGVGPGFQIRLRDQQDGVKLKKAEQDSIQALQGFFTNCGWESNPRERQRLRRDNFSGFMGKMVRDSLVMDSAPIETEYKRNRALGMDGFYAVDGATIRLCNEDGYKGDDEIFALQVVQGNLRTAYTFNDLIYVPRNPRTDVLQGGYGMSETELLVSTVTGFLNAMSYNQKFFDSNAIPKGLLHLSGDYSQDDLNSFKRYWNSMVRGINNAWTLPVMVSKNGESKATFENFGVDVNEIMFAKWMTFLTSIICAIYGIAPDEINFESFTAGASSLSGDDTEEKLINSKDKGLRPLLAHFEDLFTDYIVSDFGDKYEFRWTGLDEKTPDQQWLEEQALLTFNEARKARNWDEIKEDWADAPLNNALMQAWMAEHNPPPAPGEGMPGQPGQPGGEGEEAGAQPKDDAAGEGQDEEQADDGDEYQKDMEEHSSRLSDMDDDGMFKSFGLPDFRPAP